MNFLNDLAGDNKVAFYMGLVSLIVFLVMFFISKKKRVPIFVGVWDFVLDCVALVCFLIFMINVGKGEVKLLSFVFLVPLAISVFLSLRKPYSVGVKVFSIVGKAFFVLTGASLILLLIVLIISRMRKERSRTSFWEELKDIANTEYEGGDLETDNDDIDVPDE